MRIFDSLVHPTLDGHFLDKKNKTSFKQVTEGLREHGIAKACAVGIPNIGKYSHLEFYNECIQYRDLLYPVAGVSFRENLNDEIEEITSIGYKAIKIHPRFLGESFSKEKLIECLNIAYAKEVVVFLCTYNFTNLNNNSCCMSFLDLVEVLRAADPAKIILLHGGTVEVLRYAELVRSNSNLLLDLSFTFLKYSGSSLDLDIKFLFEKFDRRICVGSDAPDFTFEELKVKFKKMTEGLGQEKIENVGYKNIENFLGIY